MNKRRIIPSLVLNSIIFVLMIIGLILGLTIDNLGGSFFIYFTTISNILMGIASLIYLIYLILILNKNINHIPKAIEIIKLATTVSVVLTFVTVCLFLAPTFQDGDVSILFSNSCSLYHVVIPLLSLATWILFEHSSNKIRLPESLYGIIPMVIYCIIYCALALTHIKNGKVIEGYDWYGFAQFGIQYIPLAIICMIGLTYLISWLLWLANKKIDIKYESMQRFQYKRFWSIFTNGLIFILVLMAMLVRFVHDGADWTNLKYFTTQSNVFIGLMCLIYMIVEIVQFKQKQINKTFNLLKLIFTAYISITFAVTVFALTPGAAIMKIKGWPPERLYLNANIMLHVFIPVLSICNWLLLEHSDNIQFKKLFYSFIYTGLYAIFYITVAYTHVGSDGKIPMDYDWYKFCSFNPWVTVVACIAMLGMTFLFVWLLWKFNKQINIYKDITNRKIKRVSGSKH